MFDNIPGNVFPYSPECLGTFPAMDYQHSPKYLRTLPGMFEDIPRNVWQYISEYNISLILRVPRILFPVPVFQVLYTVMQRRLIFTIVVLYFRLRL